MADYVVRDTQLASVADAIRAKGGTSAPLSFPDGFVDAVEDIETGAAVEPLSVTENGTYTAPSGSAYSPVTVNVSGSGPVSVPAKEVNFRDYDGTVVYSYTPAEFAALEAMPANPDHSGDTIPLTAQGWNWSLSDAQTYVAKYGRLEVGQMYATTDGKTHVLIHLEQGRTSPILGCGVYGTVDVDWGDGTAHDTLTGTSTSTVRWTPAHQYAAPGDYDITLTCTEGSIAIYGSNSSNQYSGLLRFATGSDARNRVYQNAVRAVYCASNVTNIAAYAFYNCQSLSSISIPDSVKGIGTYAFENCFCLSSISIPKNLNLKIIGNYAFYTCYGLSSISIPNSVTSIEKAFYSCQSLSSVTIPDSVTNIGSAFQNCYCLSNISIPDSVTSIGVSAFQNCYGLGEIHFSSATPPTVAAASVFSGLSTDCKIYVPTGSLSAYTTATNYPSSSTYTYIEE